MAKVHCYILTRCPFCVAAKALLDSKGVQYEETIVDGNDALWQQMVEESGRNTAPQIFINHQSIGGFSELSALDHSGELDRLLGVSSTH